MRVSKMALLVAGILCAVGCSDETMPVPSPQPAAQPLKPADSSEQNADLQGAWQVVALEVGGQVVAADRLRETPLQYVFEEETVVVRQTGRPDRTGAFTVDLEASPQRLIITYQGRGAPPPLNGIYRISGDQLELCLMSDARRFREFPTDFTSQRSPTTDLLTLNRCP